MEAHDTRKQLQGRSHPQRPRFPKQDAHQGLLQSVEGESIDCGRLPAGFLVVAVCTRTVHSGVHNVRATEGACKIPPTDRGRHLKQRRREPPLKTAIMWAICEHGRSTRQAILPTPKTLPIATATSMRKRQSWNEPSAAHTKRKNAAKQRTTLPQMWQRGSTHRRKIRTGGQRRRYQMEYMQCARKHKRKTPEIQLACGWSRMLWGDFLGRLGMSPPQA